MKRSRVRDVMTAEVISVRPETPYKDIVTRLAHHRITAMPVVRDGQVLGVVSEADLLRKLQFTASAPAPTFESRRRRVARAKADGVVAQDVMTAPALTIGASESLTVAARVMDSGQVKRLPVLDEQHHLVGIVSRGDLLRVFLRADDDIRAAIRDDVLRGALSMPPDHLQVTVDNGVVTLAGVVDRRSTISVVVRLVEGVAGVVDVISHLSYHVDDRENRQRPLAHR